MDNLFHMKTDDIKGGDIQRLIDAKYQERQNIEYKKKMYKRDDYREQLEMLKDISSMANAHGGFIFIGIEENEEGIPIKAHDVLEIKAELERIEQSCVSCIDPRIHGLKCLPIEMPTREYIIMVYIPRSARKPHMVTLHNKTFFWIRHNRMISTMSIEEIRESCINNINIWKDIKQFLSERRAEIYANSSGIASIVIGSVPVFFNEEIIDINDPNIRDFLINPPYQTRFYNMSFPEEYPEPTLDGLVISRALHKTVELHRNGYYELRLPKELITSCLGENVLDSSLIVSMLVNYFRALAQLIEILEIEHSLITHMSLFSFTGLKLNFIKQPPHLPPSPVSNIIGKSDLLIATRQIMSLKYPEKEAIYFLEKFWNAFGAESNQLNKFFKDGLYQEPR